MNTTQNDLDKLYKEYLEKLLQDKEIVEKINSCTFSSPLFLNTNVPNGMLKEKKYKILFIGQQTKGWDSNFKNSDLELNNIPEFINELKKLYYNFNYGKRLDRKHYNGYLWQFQRKLLNTINNFSNSEFGLIWTNILRFDEHGGKIKDKRDIEKISYNKNYILRKEIEILKPDVVVFVTGPSYDSILNETFDDLKFIPVAEVSNDSKRFSILESKYLPIMSFRTYHPRALYQNKHLRSLREPIINFIANKLKSEFESKNHI